MQKVEGIFNYNYTNKNTKPKTSCLIQDISKPTTMEWGTPLQAMLGALELEKTVTI